MNVSTDMTNKFLTLTNANPQNRNMPVSIRTDLIITVHANVVQREDGTTEMVSYIFAPPHGTWEVLETHEYIMNNLEKDHALGVSG